MRIAVATLFALFALAVVGSFAVAPGQGWWLPGTVTGFGRSIDGLFYLILWIVGAFFVLTLGLLVWSIWRHGPGGGGRPLASDGHGRLELVWTVVPGAILLWLALAQLGLWKEIKFESSLPRAPGGGPAAPLAEVWASQFDWSFVHPGADGRFGSGDDLRTTYELVVPAGEKLVLRLHSRDVIHSFFVPRFRLKQDVLPGRATLVWFECDEPGSYDLLCAELCGWGHYRMTGRVRALPPAEYERWLAEQARRLQSNGTEDRR